jgi:hypothetical protein
MRRAFKVLGAVLGAMILVCVLLINLVSHSWGGAKDQMIAQSLAPDEKIIAEIHQSTTPMFGGPDTIYVNLMGEKVYVRVYECDDYSGYALHWENSRKLIVSYTACRPDPPTPENDAVTHMETSWNDIEISYRDSGHTATH